MIKEIITFPKHSAYFLEQDICFEQWQQQVIRYRNVFSKRKEQTWLLFTEDSYSFSLYFFALLAANKRIILPPNGQPEQLKLCMQSAEIFVGSFISNNDIAITDDFHYFDLTKAQHCSDISKNNAKSIAGYEEKPNSPSKPTLKFTLDNEIVFFTSGSSGHAKAIVKTFAQLIIEVELLEQTFGEKVDGHTSNDQGFSRDACQQQNAIVMATVSHQHIYGLLFKLLWPLWSGRYLHLSVFSYPEHLVQQIKTYQQGKYSQRKICLISSPAYYHRLLSDNVLVQVKDQFSVLFSSGGPLNNEVAINLKGALAKAPIEVFGSTETGGIAWRQRQALDDEVWLAFSGIKCQNNNAEQRLALLSPYLITSDVSGNNWYQTDDRVELIDPQRFKLLGRTDRIIKIEEKRCSLDELGLCLLKHDWVKEAYVLLLTKQGKRDTLAAILVLSAEGKLALANEKKFSFDRQLKAHLKQYVEAIVVPRKFRYLENLPYNNQGKLNKKQLEHLFD